MDINLQSLDTKYEGTEEVAKVLDLLYVQRKFEAARAYVKAHISEDSLEHNYFIAKTYAYQIKYKEAIQHNGYVSKSKHINSLFYLFNNAGDSQTLDIVNVGHDLRNRGQVDRSNQFMLDALNDQLNKKMVNRTTVVQTLLNKSVEKQYLEIGVFVGQNFLQIQANRKVAVDPVLRIKLPEKFKPTTTFYEIPSDEFFKTSDDEILTKKANVVFIDGLHTYEQSLRDVIYSLDHIKADGIIVMHDCYPKSKAAAHPDMATAKAMDGFKGFWNGDVFKAILWLRSFRADLEVMVLDTDHGLGVVRKGKPHSMLNFTEAEIKEMTYEKFAENHIHNLNLKEKEYFHEWSSAL